MLRTARPRRQIALAAVCAGMLTSFAGAAGVVTEQSETAAEPKVMQLPIRTDGPKSLDPVEGSTTYDNMACAQFYETLLTIKEGETFSYFD